MFEPVKIRRITPKGIRKVCDVTVAENHSYIGNGIINHNTSSNPNLQNIPNDKRFPIKGAFKPKKGSVFLIYDWSTIEIRVMADESNDVEMIKILQEGRDVHQETTDSINDQFGTSLDRGQGKTINFAVLYLMGAPSLAYTLNKDLQKRIKEGKLTAEQYREMKVSQNTAQKIIDGFFTKYYGFAQYVEDLAESVKESGWVWTLGGRRRPIPELKLRKTYGSGKRKACNTPIQGGAADLMKLGIIKLQKLYEEKGYEATTLMYVHDEYVIECREDQAEACSIDVKELMENIYPTCKVPIKCDGGIYYDWAGLKSGDTSGVRKNKVTKLNINKLRILKLIR